MSALFSFFREVEDDDGKRYSQMATVFAEDRAQAEDVLAQDLKELRASDKDEDTDPAEEPGYSMTSDWTVDEVGLDTPKVVSLAITGWPQK